MGPAGALLLVGRGMALAVLSGEQGGEGRGSSAPPAPHDGEKRALACVCMGDVGTHTLALQRLTFSSTGTGWEAAGQERVVGGVGLAGQLGQPYIPAEQGRKRKETHCIVTTTYKCINAPQTVYTS